MSIKKPDGTDFTFGDAHYIIDKVVELAKAMINMIAQIVNGAKDGFKDSWDAEYPDYSYTE